jgi:hypothetical protein
MREAESIQDQMELWYLTHQSRISNVTEIITHPNLNHPVHLCQQWGVGKRGGGEVTSSATAIIARQESVRRRGRRRGEECECRDRRGSIERVVLRMSRGVRVGGRGRDDLGFLGGKISETERHLIPEFHHHTQKG